MREFVCIHRDKGPVVSGRQNVTQDDPELVIEQAPYDAELAAMLVAEVQLEYVERYGGRDETPMEVSEFARSSGAFFIAYIDGVAVGCGGLRRHDGGVAEIKRMYVRAGHRRQGFAWRLLRALEDKARQLGYSRVVLETGTGQPEAIALYISAGYEAVAGFGRYRDQPLNRCFAKAL